jgi:hypothetical protein
MSERVIAALAGCETDWLEYLRTAAGPRFRTRAER